MVLHTTITKGATFEKNKTHGVVVTPIVKFNFAMDRTGVDMARPGGLTRWLNALVHATYIKGLMIGRRERTGITLKYIHHQRQGTSCVRPSYDDSPGTPKLPKTTTFRSLAA